MMVSSSRSPARFLIYLAEKTGKLLPKEPKLRAKLIETIMFQMSFAISIL